MSEYFFNVTKVKPATATARKWNRVAKKHGGGAYIEVNRKQGAALGINNGNYQGWFVLPNRGNPFAQNTANEIRAELGI